MTQLNSLLRQKLEEFSIELPTDCSDQLAAYAEALWTWNRSLNLTRHTDCEKFVIRDVLDTVQLSELIHAGEHVLDIGSGGGVPGLTLAIMRPDLNIALCESVGKKANALQHMVDTLQIEATVFPLRAEELLDASRFDVCTARAVGPLWKICRWLNHYWLEAGRLLATKGPRWTEEKQVAQEMGLLKKVHLKVAAEYRTPVIDAQNVIVKIWSHVLPDK